MFAKTTVASILVLATSFHLTAQNDQLLATINSDQVEFAPSFSPDGQSIIWLSNRESDFKWYESKKNEKHQWLAPQPFESLNKYATPYEFLAGSNYSYDGRYLYFFAYFDDKGLGSKDIYLTESVEGKWAAPVNIGAPVNSADYEGYPSLSPDGSKLFFMRVNSKPNPGKKFCFEILMAEKQLDGTWGEPKLLPEAINKGCEQFPRIMADNETLIFSSDGGIAENDFDLYLTRNIAGNRWSKPVPMAFANTSADEGLATVSESGEMLLLTKGNDILNYTIPEELRPRKTMSLTGTITDQTTGKLLSATVAITRNGAAPNTRYVHIKGGRFHLPIVAGNDYDISFVADGFTPKSLSVKKNSFKVGAVDTREINLVPAKNQFVVVVKSATNGQPLQAAIDVGETSAKAEELAPGMYRISGASNASQEIEVMSKGHRSYVGQLSFSDEPKTREVLLEPGESQLLIEVVDATSGKPLKTYLQIRDNKNKKGFYRGMMDEGKYQTELAFDRLYQFKITRPGYFYHQETIDLRNVFYGRTIKKTISMLKLEEGNKLALNTINFQFNSDELTQDSKVELDHVFDLMKQNKGIVLEVSAHTDDRGDPAYNMDLSQRRAQSVMNYLLTKGVPEQFMKPAGYGQTKPLVPNTTKANRAKNRRVEFVVLESK